MGEFMVIEDLKNGFAKNSVMGERSTDTLAAAAHTGRIAKVQSMIEEGVDMCRKYIFRDAHRGRG